ncbi:hypothetical protein [uncultured Acetatifactor sp.]|uniref:hypothetical protein n=1 Tax=uncultured Acetatifactor sp. TaxID=1671927 RepID=UPI00263859CA|nr:hypothetical protein [uncultured Acetatifactor sp.]
MNYVWEVLLAARESDTEDTALHFYPEREPSPYMEASFAEMNLTAPEDDKVGVNPLYRFSDVFSGMFVPDIQDYEKARSLFLDVFMHCMARSDLRSGMHRQEYYFRFLREDLLGNVFGRQAAEAFSLFGMREQKRIVAALFSLYRSGHGKAIFRKLMTELYVDSIVYEGRDRAEALYLYVGKRETEEERKRVGFLTDTFLPVNEEVKVFYDSHFGVMDLDETMTMDRIMLI